MAGASADGEVNHWPAFVDVLTTVIMVVTFLLVIMSAAVMVLSKRTLAQLQEKYETKQASSDDTAQNAASSPGQSVNRLSSPADAEAGSSVAQLGSILKSETIVDGEEKLTIRTRETPDTLKVKVKALEEADATKGVEVKTADLLMRVDFEPTAVRYDPVTSKQITDFLRSKQAPGTKFEIWSFAPQVSSISEAQRLAFYRAAITRNLLIQAGIPPADILTQIRVTDATQRDGHNVRVVVKP